MREYNDIEISLDERKGGRREEMCGKMTGGWNGTDGHGKKRQEPKTM